MRTSPNILFVLLLVSSHIYSQNHNNCTYYNSFRSDGTLDSLPMSIEYVSNTGLITLNYSSPASSGDITDFVAALNLSSAHTFVYQEEQNSQIQDNGVYRYYDQYYNQIKVEGGGIITGLIIGTGQDDACEELHSIIPSIQYIEQLNTIPNIQIASALSTVIAQDIELSYSDTSSLQYELVVSVDPNGTCSQKLLWKIKYTTSVNKVIWIDAQSGAIFKQTIIDDFLLAPTISYGNSVNLNNLQIGNEHILQSEDNRIKTWYTAPNCHTNNFGNIVLDEWTESTIPRTSNQVWSNEADFIAYQAHYSTELVLEQFDILNNTFENIPLDYGTINISTCNRSIARMAGDISDNYMFLGYTPGVVAPFALHDVIAHEFSHNYINQFPIVDGFEIGSGSIIEGSCDIIGTYIESKLQTSIDYLMGDDEPEVALLASRNLRTPGADRDCFDDVENLGDVHQRSLPLTHWFYLITNGNSALGITPVDLEITIEVILETLRLLTPQADYHEFRDVSLLLFDQKFTAEQCNLKQSVRRAWSHICIPTDDRCGVDVTVPTTNPICEEDNFIRLEVINAEENSTWRWTLVGQEDCYYTLSCGSNCGSCTHGPVLYITGIPQHNYYPQSLKIIARKMGTTTEYSKTIKINDCDNDDPTCDEFFNQGNIILSTDNLAESNITVKNIIITDIKGQRIYYGPPIDFHVVVSYNEIFFITYLDIDGHPIRTEKNLLIE